MQKVNSARSARSDHFFPLHAEKEKDSWERRTQKSTSRGEKRSEWSEPADLTAVADSPRHSPSEPSRKLLKPEDVAEWLGVTPAWVIAHANGNRRPHLPSVKLGRYVRFRPEDVERALTELTREGAA
ncbi:MAG: helix-turn-helix domain-containing protein [Bryobacteraceae bacterium]